MRFVYTAKTEVNLVVSLLANFPDVFTIYLSYWWLDALRLHMFL